MALNKQSNVYTIIYIVVLVVVVGAALAITSLSLKDKQVENANADKMRQILASVHIIPEKGKVVEDYNKYITESFIVDSEGKRIEGDAFDVNVEAQSKQADDAKRKLPVYVCTLADGAKKYILPVYGAGLWGPIWGYVSLDADGSTLFGAYFAHQGETPGLGAEIEKPAFSDQFAGLHMFKDGQYMPVDVVKKGQKPLGNEDYVDGISGGTITSKGVGAMLNNCLMPYEAFLRSLSTESK